MSDVIFELVFVMYVDVHIGKDSHLAYMFQDFNDVHFFVNFDFTLDEQLIQFVPLETTAAGTRVLYKKVNTLTIRQLYDPVLRGQLYLLVG